jgi:purine nucleosidase
VKMPGSSESLSSCYPNPVPRAFLIDTDTASDDAVALIMALSSRDVEVRGITIVAGNVPVAQGSRNALYVAELCGSAVPVFLGAERPLLRAYAHAEWFHGRDGLGGHDYPAPRRTAEPTHAVEAIIETARACPGLTLVTLGPLTNVSLALARAPEIAARVARCIIMGGAPCCEGNVTPAAEYNIWVDPDAARIVARSGLPIELVGWHLSRGAAVLNAVDISHILNMGTELARFAIECNSTAMAAYRVQTGEHGISLPDPVAMSIALDPSICTSASDHLLEIETAGDLTRGMTVVDRLDIAGNDRNSATWRQAVQDGRRARICWNIDVPRWKRALFTALAGSSERQAGAASMYSGRTPGRACSTGRASRDGPEHPSPIPPEPATEGSER